MNIRKIAGQGDYYTNGFSIDYPCFIEDQKLIPKVLSKQQKLGADSKVI